MQNVTDPAVLSQLRIYLESKGIEWPEDPIVHWVWGDMLYYIYDAEVGLSSRVARVPYEFL